MQLQSPIGPFEFIPRDFVAMPKNGGKQQPVQPSKLRGVTAHYSGSTLAGYYRNLTELEGDHRCIRGAIYNHNARRPKISDVGYNWGVGRSGVIFEMRGIDVRNAANGTLPARARRDYPLFTLNSNRYWQSLFFCVGVDGEYAQPTEAQWEAAKKAVAYIAQHHNITNCKVNGHRDVRATACPGTPIYPRLGELVPGVLTPGPAPAPAPAPPTGDGVLAAIAAAITQAKTFTLNRGTGPVVGPEGDAIFWLQIRLNQLLPGRRPLVTDRWFGANTEKAVRAFQKQERLTIDGWVGAQTWTALFP